jgi:CheY-like chemotaxis protein
MKPHILLVEDNEGDIMLTTEALSETKATVEISIVKDGKAAIDFVTQAGSYTGVSLPDLILLDVNLPKKSGHEVLHYIKNDEKVKHIPVIMLTTSGSELDVNLSYQNHANCYIVKPIDVDKFASVIASIEQFWFSTVRRPTRKITMDEKGH